LVDIMPLRNWIYAVTTVSILLDLIGPWGRFHLSRIDAQRAEGRLQTGYHRGRNPPSGADP